MMNVKQKLSKSNYGKLVRCFMFCTISLLNKWLGLSTNDKSPYLPDTIAAILKENVELQVLLMLFVMYGIFYLHYRRKLSA